MKRRREICGDQGEIPAHQPRHVDNKGGDRNTCGEGKLLRDARDAGRLAHMLVVEVRKGERIHR